MYYNRKDFWLGFKKGVERKKQEIEEKMAEEHDVEVLIEYSDILSEINKYLEVLELFLEDL